jgi:hypothetical protein
MRSYYEYVYQSGNHDQDKDVRELVGEDETNMSNKSINANELINHLISWFQKNLKINVMPHTIKYQ